MKDLEAREDMRLYLRLPNLFAVSTPVGDFQSNARTAVGMWKIGAEDIRAFPIPAPPVKTQRDIVCNVRELRDQIARHRAEAAKLSDQARADIEAIIRGVKPAPT